MSRAAIARSGMSSSRRPRRTAKRVEQACSTQQIAEACGQRRCNIILLARKQVGDAAGIEGPRTLLLGDRAHDDWGQHSEPRSTRALAQPRILANRIHKCGLLPAAEQ